MSKVSIWIFGLAVLSLTSIAKSEVMNGVMRDFDDNYYHFDVDERNYEEGFDICTASINRSMLRPLIDEYLTQNWSKGSKIDIELPAENILYKPCQEGQFYNSPLPNKMILLINKYTGERTIGYSRGGLLYIELEYEKWSTEDDVELGGLYDCLVIDSENLKEMEIKISLKSKLYSFDYECEDEECPKSYGNYGTYSIVHREAFFPSVTLVPSPGEDLNSCRRTYIITKEGKFFIPK